jgi:hypothetical protein
MYAPHVSHSDRAQRLGRKDGRRREQGSLWCEHCLDHHRPPVMLAQGRACPLDDLLAHVED